MILRSTQDRIAVLDELPESDIEDIFDNDIHEETSTSKCAEIKLIDGTVLKKRTEKKIIRYVRYSKEKDPENFYREMLLLFYPWNQENKVKREFQTYGEAFTEVAQIVMGKRHEYEYNIQDSEMLD